MSTVEHLYEESKVKILRLYFSTKMIKVELSSDEEVAETEVTSTPVVDLTGTPPHCSTDVQEMDSLAQQEITDPKIIFGATSDEDVPLDDTLSWNGLPLWEADEPQPAPWNHQPPQMPEEQQVAPLIIQPPPQGMGETQIAPVTLIIRRGHCLTDLIKAFTDPDILIAEVFIKMRLPNGKLEEGEGSGVTWDCLTEFYELRIISVKSGKQLAEF